LLNAVVPKLDVMHKTLKVVYVKIRECSKTELPTDDILYITTYLIKSMKVFQLAMIMHAIYFTSR
jgi:hypothetical protein